jgi:hypothetical protein
MKSLARTTSLALATSLALTTSLALVACAPEDIVVATLAADAGEEGGADAGGCKTNDDCQPGFLCARTDCGAPTGTCEVRPVVCEDVGPPVCGCDGVMYWNDCLRLRNGVTASQQGRCTTNVATCNDPSAAECPLPPGVASCARLIPPGMMCSPMAPGFCWVLPSTCPPMGPGDRWASCRFPRTCQSPCDAIQSGEPHFLVPPGATCM